MNNQSNNDYDKDLSWSEDPADVPFETVKTENEDKKVFFVPLIKTFSMMILAMSVLIFVGIAWFSMNKNVGTAGMGVKTQATSFEIKALGSSGLYDNYITRVDNEYTSGSQTSSSSSKIILQLTNDSQMENLWKKNTPPTQEDLDWIKRIESTEYGLNPGDHGTLKFSIVPSQGSSGTMSIRIKPVVSCFKTEYYSSEDTGHTPGYQKDVITAMDESDAGEGLAIGFTHTHISLYYKADEDNNGTEEMHLIPEDGFVVSDISSETEVVIYWFWPEELDDILELEIEDMDSSGATELRKAFFASPDDYLEKIYTEDDFSGIVIPESGTESARNIQAQEILDSPVTYNYYSTRFNSADQTIGDKVRYILVEVVAEQSNQE